jgi:hypothetical protein
VLYQLSYLARGGEMVSADVPAALQRPSAVIASAIQPTVKPTRITVLIVR